MEPDFLRFVWRHSWRSQLGILAVTVLIFPLVYVSLELPKRIINDAIGGEDGPRFLFGIPLERFDYLLVLCALLLFLVALINGLKWLLQVSMGRAGERMLRRLRHALFEHVLRFPMARFRGGRQGELVQAMMGEIDPIGGFVGEVLATPVFQTGLLLVYVGFVFVQDFWLGMAAVAVIPLQAWLIPRLQARVIRLNRERAIGARGVADFLGESITGMPETHVDGTAQWRLARLSAMLHRQADIRVALFRRKNAIKAINNLINQLPPLFFYAFGGWQVIEGRLDLGALVAVVAAQREMAQPWRELLVYFQNWMDYTSRYAFVVEGFTRGDTLGPERITGAAGERPLAGPITVEIAEAGAGCGGLIAPRFEIPEGATVAVTGGSLGPREALLQMLVGLQAPRSGAVAIGGQRLDTASLPCLSAAVGHAPAAPYLLDASMLDNLAAGLLRAAPQLGEPGLAHEARLTGNSTADAQGDWIDYAAAGVADRAGFEALTLRMAGAVGLVPDLRGLALDSPVDPALAAELLPLIERARRVLALTPDAPALDDLVEPWRRHALCRNATLIENLTFGAFAGTRSTPEELLARPDVAAALAASGALRSLVDIGARIAAEFRDLVEATGGDSAILDEVRGYPRDVILAAAEEASRSASPWRAAARRRLYVSLATRYTPDRDRFDVIDAGEAGRLVAMRMRVAAGLAEAPGYAPFDGDDINPGLTLLENLLGGALRHDRRGSARGLTEAVERAFIEAGGDGMLQRLGLVAGVGREGGRLTPGARRRVVLARALIKRPRVIVVEAGMTPEVLAQIRMAVPEATVIYAADTESDDDSVDMELRIEPGGKVTVHRRHARGAAHGAE
jgi:putative ABC transport system ATP-binding protein